MSQIVCVKDGGKFSIAKSGAYVIETRSGGREPYKLWAADVQRCARCGDEIVAGFSRQQLGEHYQDDFPGKLERMLGDDRYVVYLLLDWPYPEGYVDPKGWIASWLEHGDGLAVHETEEAHNEPFHESP